MDYVGHVFHCCSHADYPTDWGLQYLAVTGSCGVFKGLDFDVSFLFDEYYNVLLIENC
jgi:hypothetical protein